MAKDGNSQTVLKWALGILGSILILGGGYALNQLDTLKIMCNEHAGKAFHPVGAIMFKELQKDVTDIKTIVISLDKRVPR